jgi:hypothetical protein
MAMGAVGLSLAGFAGLFAALDHSASGRSAVFAWRIRHVVVYGFVVSFSGFGTVALHTVTGGDVTLTVRVVSLLLGVTHLVLIPLETRRGPAWPDEFDRRAGIAFTVIFAAVMLGNVVVGSVGYLQLIFLLLLSDPAAIFIRTVSEMASSTGREAPRPARDTSDEGESGATIGS